MIQLDQVSKSFAARGGRRHILRAASISIPKGRRIALLGANGAGKSTLLKLISGQMSCDAGRIIWTGQVSWQIGFAGNFHPELTGQQNTRFVARIYGVDTDELCGFAQNFAQIGRQFYMPVKSYSSGMRARLSFGIAMGIPFSCYLIDEITAVGDMAFRHKCAATLRNRLQIAGAVIVSHSEPTVRELCEHAMILKDGHLRWYDSLDHGLAVYRNIKSAS